MWYPHFLFSKSTLFIIITYFTQSWLLLSHSLPIWSRFRIRSKIEFSPVDSAVLWVQMKWIYHTHPAFYVLIWWTSRDVKQSHAVSSIYLFQTFLSCFPFTRQLKVVNGTNIQVIKGLSSNVIKYNKNRISNQNRLSVHLPPKDFSKEHFFTDARGNQQKRP